MRKIIRLVAGFWIACTISFSAHAQYAVLDIPNLIQSIQGVMSDLVQEGMLTEQTMVQAQEYALQIQQYYAKLQELQNWQRKLENDYNQIKSFIDDPKSLLGLLDSIRKANAMRKEYGDKVKVLYGDLDNAKNVATTLYNKYAASGLDFKKWSERMADVNKARGEGDGFMTEYQVKVLDQVKDRYDELQKLQSKIYSTDGTHQSMQLLNTHMNALLGTMNQMLEANTVAAQRKLQDEVIQHGKEKQSDESAQAFDTKIDEMRTKNQNAINSMINYRK
ncbi:hypothetical protein [Azonexus hydrophilus]|uniref:P-type conjugative transfer protein TrbJ n=1 Tax=Azonexus hydrophilus TaxID=418702 RepID=A0ABZ2XLJ3_9RHOO